MNADPAEFYSACNLTGNPFRANPSLEDDPRADIWAGYAQERRQLEKFLVRTRTDQVGNINFLLLYGDYGTGKSHALLWARYQILEKRAEEFNAAVYYVQTLKTGPKMSFAGAFKEDIVAKSSLVDDLLGLKQWLEMAVVRYKDHRGLRADESREKILAELVGSVELMNFVKKLLACHDAAAVRALLLPAKMSDYEAMKLLTTIVNLFVLEITPASEPESFRKAVYLFIDELDLLTQVPAKEARETNELFRHIYDSCPNALCFVLGFTASSAELPVLFHEYVLSRVSKQIILEHMEVEEAKDFIRKILDSERADPAGKAGFFPFEEAAIDAIVSQIVSITPRKLVNAMQQVLEEARLEGAEPSKEPISLEFLDEHDILEDVL